MKIAIVADIHSNLPALTQVLASAEKAGVEQVYCAGDLVGYGPFPNESIDLIRSACSGVVAGNHDAALAGKVGLDRFNRAGAKALRWTKKMITPANADYLRQLPMRIVREEFTLVHASPADPDSWEYVLSAAEAQEAFGAFSTRLCFMGHSHVPLIIGEDMSFNAFRKDCRFLVNVGSVGQPRDGDPRAAFGLLDTVEWTYELVRVEYDVQKTAAATVEAGLPAALARRLLTGY